MMMIHQRQFVGKAVVVVVARSEKKMHHHHHRRSILSILSSLMMTNIFLLFLLLTATMTNTTTVNAAHSRSRIIYRRGNGSTTGTNNENYDRSITTFSPDGRLLQVEYGMEAAMKGSTIICIKINRQSINKIIRDHNSNNVDNEIDINDIDIEEGICFIIENSSFGKVHRIDHHMYMLTSGLAGDSRILSNYIRSSCQNHRLQYGDDDNDDDSVSASVPVQQVAKMTSNVQHLLTRRPGGRPFGCTSILLGIDPIFYNNNDNNNNNMLQLFETDPGGSINECTVYAIAGQHRFSTIQNENDIELIIMKLILSLQQQEEQQQSESTSPTTFIDNSKNNNDNTKNEENNKEKVIESIDDNDKKKINNNNNNKKKKKISITLQNVATELTALMLNRNNNNINNNKNDKDKKNDKTSSLSSSSDSSSSSSSSSVVDVWIMKPNRKKRGGIHTICYPNIHSKEKLLQLFSPKKKNKLIN